MTGCPTYTQLALLAIFGYSLSNFIFNLSLAVGSGLPHDKAPEVYQKVKYWSLIAAVSLSLGIITVIIC